MVESGFGAAGELVLGEAVLGLIVGDVGVGSGVFVATCSGLVLGSGVVA